MGQTLAGMPLPVSVNPQWRSASVRWRPWTAPWWIPVAAPAPAMSH
ncbi:hypothetical protein GZL_06223 [Streptomyces sp. 769]|nr:hypothetical protein GZL_06223 [Streptomyces sp. 769]